MKLIINSKFDSQEMDIIQQYHRENLYEQVLEGLALSDKRTPSIEDLWPVDQFHIGGAKSTLKLLEMASISTTDKVLDVGCGLGGPARLIAQNLGCEVYGVDLTPAYVDTAIKLSKLVGFEDRTRFSCADALALPYPDNEFEVVWTQHVQMNIKDKEAFYTQLVRVLKPGGTLVYHDVFKGVNEEMIYPTPWSDDGVSSFLFHHDALQFLLNAKMTALHHQDDTEFAKQFFQDMLSKIELEGKPNLGLHLVMGPSAPTKMANLLSNLQRQALEVHQGVYKKP